VNLYHRTTAENAHSILIGGFRNADGYYLTDRKWSGVWVSDRPLDSNEGAEGDTLLKIAAGFTEAELADFEWIEEGKGYREWLVDAALLNAKARRVTVVSAVELQRPQ
jgi:hypothetical protein